MRANRGFRGRNRGNDIRRGNAGNYRGQRGRGGFRGNQANYNQRGRGAQGNNRAIEINENIPMQDENNPQPLNLSEANIQRRNSDNMIRVDQAVRLGLLEDLERKRNDMSQYTTYKRNRLQHHVYDDLSISDYHTHRVNPRIRRNSFGSEETRHNLSVHRRRNGSHSSHSHSSHSSSSSNSRHNENRNRVDPRTLIYDPRFIDDYGHFDHIWGKDNKILLNYQKRRFEKHVKLDYTNVEKQMNEEINEINYKYFMVQNTAENRNKYHCNREFGIIQDVLGYLIVQNMIIITFWKKLLHESEINIRYILQMLLKYNQVYNIDDFEVRNTKLDVASKMIKINSKWYPYDDKNYYNRYLKRPQLTLDPVFKHMGKIVDTRNYAFAFNGSNAHNKLNSMRKVMEDNLMQVYFTDRCNTMFVGIGDNLGRLSYVGGFFYNYPSSADDSDKIQKYKTMSIHPEYMKIYQRFDFNEYIQLKQLNDVPHIREAEQMHNSIPITMHMTDAIYYNPEFMKQWLYTLVQYPIIPNDCLLTTNGIFKNTMDTVDKIYGSISTNINGVTMKVNGNAPAYEHPHFQIFNKIIDIQFIEFLLANRSVTHSVFIDSPNFITYQEKTRYKPVLYVQFLDWVKVDEDYYYFNIKIYYDIVEADGSRILDIFFQIKDVNPVNNRDLYMKKDKLSALQEIDKKFADKVGSYTSVKFYDKVNNSMVSEVLSCFLNKTSSSKELYDHMYVLDETEKYEEGFCIFDDQLYVLRRIKSDKITNNLLVSQDNYRFIHYNIHVTINREKFNEVINLYRTLYIKANTIRNVINSILTKAKEEWQIDLTYEYAAYLAIIAARIAGTYNQTILKEINLHKHLYEDICYDPDLTWYEQLSGFLYKFNHNTNKLSADINEVLKSENIKNLKVKLNRSYEPWYYPLAQYMILFFHRLVLLLGYIGLYVVYSVYWCYWKWYDWYYQPDYNGYALMDNPQMNNPNIHNYSYYEKFKEYLTAFSKWKLELPSEKHPISILIEKLETYTDNPGSTVKDVLITSSNIFVVALNKITDFSINLIFKRFVSFLTSNKKVLRIMLTIFIICIALSPLIIVVVLITYPVPHMDGFLHSMRETVGPIEISFDWFFVLIITILPLIGLLVFDRITLVNYLIMILFEIFVRWFFRSYYINNFIEADNQFNYIYGFSYYNYIYYIDKLTPVLFFIKILLNLGPIGLRDNSLIISVWLFVAVLVRMVTPYNNEEYFDKIHIDLGIQSPNDCLLMLKLLKEMFKNNKKYIEENKLTQRNSEKYKIKEIKEKVISTKDNYFNEPLSQKSFIIRGEIVEEPYPAKLNNCYENATEAVYRQVQSKIDYDDNVMEDFRTFIQPKLRKLFNDLELKYWHKIELDKYFIGLGPKLKEFKDGFEQFKANDDVIKTYKMHPKTDEKFFITYEKDPFKIKARHIAAQHKTCKVVMGILCNYIDDLLQHEDWYGPGKNFGDRCKIFDKYYDIISFNQVALCADGSAFDSTQHKRLLEIIDTYVFNLIIDNHAELNDTIDTSLLKKICGQTSFLIKHKNFIYTVQGTQMSGRMNTCLSNTLRSYCYIEYIKYKMKQKINELGAQFKLYHIDLERICEQVHGDDQYILLPSNYVEYYKYIAYKYVYYKEDVSIKHGLGQIAKIFDLYPQITGSQFLSCIILFNPHAKQCRFFMVRLLERYTQLTPFTVNNNKINIWKFRLQNAYIAQQDAIGVLASPTLSLFKKYATKQLEIANEEIKFCENHVVFKESVYKAVDKYKYLLMVKNKWGNLSDPEDFEETYNMYLEDQFNITHDDINDFNDTIDHITKENWLEMHKSTLIDKLYKNVKLTTYQKNRNKLVQGSQLIKKLDGEHISVFPTTQ
jgi:hypothetical protein